MNISVIKSFRFFGVWRLPQGYMSTVSDLPCPVPDPNRKCGSCDRWRRSEHQRKPSHTACGTTNSEPMASQAALSSLTLSSELKFGDRCVLRRIGASSGLAQSRNDDGSMISEPPASSRMRLIKRGKTRIEILRRHLRSIKQMPVRDVELAAHVTRVLHAGEHRLYQARPENIELMTFLPEGGTRRVSRCWQM